MNTEGKEIIRIEPPNWWVGMKKPLLQLLVYGNDIAEFKVSVKHESVNLIKVNKVENPNYLFLDLLIDKSTRAGSFKINFKTNTRNVSYDYKLNSKEDDTDKHNGFDQSDVIYLIMPDRFSNGNPLGNNVDGILEKADRKNGDGRHGGDLTGIRNHLDYIVDLGVTAIWLNPVLENNMPHVSYHGYAITDFYKVDPRHGSNQEYKQMVEECHKKGLKVIIDMVFNHSGSNHWFIKDLPAKDWIHQFSEFTRTNYRAPVVSDPYSSDRDANLLQNGWFDVTMPDLNQKNPFLANYLIQNSLWWIEFSGLDGIRMDTYPYPDKEMMAKWVKRVLEEYPKFNIVGESWLQKESMTAYWQKDFPAKDGYNSHLPSVTDFPINSAVIKALNEPDTWTGGLFELYYVLAQDFLYTDASMNVIFLDNHDVNRIYTSLKHNFNKFKMAMSFLFTTRGIPQMYYGTEILMDGNEGKGHGYIRQDFPGGWEGDKMNIFTKKNISQERLLAYEFTKKLLNWRKTNKVIHKGKLKHFIPENGTYVYFRYSDNEAVMVIINKSDAQFFDTERYNEILKSYSYAKDIITDENINDLKLIWLEGYSARILELKK